MSSLDFLILDEVIVLERSDIRVEELILDLLDLVSLLLHNLL